MGAYLELPHAYVAASINDYPDEEWKDILQAKLLTEESYEEIGEWFGVDKETVDFFESVFFDIRDRLRHRGWIIKVILGNPEERSSRNREGRITANQRGLLYRLFAYYGGSEALEAALTGFMPSTLPSAKRDIQKWYDKALEQIIQSKAATAARAFEVNKFNVMQVLELAMGGAIQRQLASNSAGGGMDEFADKVTTAMSNWSLAEPGFSKRSEEERHLLSGPVEARVQERVMLLHGEQPESLITDEQRLDKERLEFNQVEN